MLQCGGIGTEIATVPLSSYKRNKTSNNFEGDPGCTLSSDACLCHLQIHTRVMGFIIYAIFWPRGRRLRIHIPNRALHQFTRWGFEHTPDRALLVVWEYIFMIKKNYVVLFKIINVVQRFIVFHQKQNIWKIY